MLSNVQMKVVIRAVKIRMRNGEELEAILDSYPKLTAEESAEIREEIQDF